MNTKGAEQGGGGRRGRGEEEELPAPTTTKGGEQGGEEGEMILRSIIGDKENVRKSRANNSHGHFNRHNISHLCCKYTPLQLDHVILLQNVIAIGKTASVKKTAWSS